MPTASSRRNASTSFERRGADLTSKGAGGLLYLLYRAGPVVVIALGIAIAIGLAVTGSPFQGVQAFAAFFLPVMTGSYALMLFDDKISAVLARGNPLALLLVTFVCTIILGRYLTSSDDDGRWLLAAGFLGLIIAVFIIAQIGRGAPGAVRTRLRRMGVDETLIHVMVALVSAVGVLVLMGS